MYKNVISEIKNYTDHQLYVKYRIIVNTDGSVYDKVNSIWYKCLMDWACAPSITNYYSIDNNLYYG